MASPPERDEAQWLPPAIRSRALPWRRRLVQTAWCLGSGPRLERALGSLDVAHLIQPFPPARVGSPLLVTVHDLFPLDCPEWYPRSERWTFHRSMALMARRAARMIVPSRYVADRLAAMGVSRGVEVVPHGVSGAFSRTRSAAEMEATCGRFGVQPGSFVVFLGALVARKNAPTLIRALAQLRGEKMALVMIGPGQRDGGQGGADIARLDDRIRVVRTGYVPDDDAATLVQSAAALAHPALAEGFGLVPLEAMALGTPVVASRSSSIPEVVGDAGILVDEPSSPSAWADALSRAIGDPTLRAEMAAAGRQRAAEFTWERAARTMLDIYRDVAST